MLRLTFTLVAALYAGFAIWGNPEEETTVAVAETVVLQTNVPVVLEASAPAQADVARAETTEIVVPDAATIAASTPAPADLIATPAALGEPRRISLVTPAVASAPEAAAAPEPEAEPRFMEVTGSRVNLRSGPSTSNGVVDSLVRGTLVEPIGEPVDGWIELRAVESGVRGFMAARFVAPAG